MAALLVLAALGVGTLGRLLVALGDASDQWGVHTKVAKHAGRRWITYEMADSLVPGIFPYPMLVHFLISRFPRRLWGPVSLALNLLPDAVLALAVFALVRIVLAARLGGTELSFAGFAGMLVFLTLPLLMPATSRIKATNGRAPGLLLTSVYFLAVGILLEGGSVALWSPVAVAAMILCVLASLFAMQVVVFFSILLSIAYASALPVLVVTAGLVVCVAAPRLGAREILLFWLNHKIWYRICKDMDGTTTRRTLFRDLLRLPWLLRRDPVKAARVVVLESPLLIALYSAVPLWLGAWTLSLHGGWSIVWADPILRFLCALAGVSVVMFLLTTLRPLLIIGQAERYLEYSAPAFVALFVYARYVHGGEPAATLFLVVAIQICVTILVNLADPKLLRALGRFDLYEAEDERLVAFLETLPAPARVATVPIKLPILLSGLSRSGRPGDLFYYYRFIQRPGRPFDGFDYYREDAETVNLFRGTPRDLAEKYGIQYVVGENAFVRSHGRGAAGVPTFLRALEGLPVLYRSDKYSVYEVPAAG